MKYILMLIIVFILTYSASGQNVFENFDTPIDLNYRTLLLGLGDSSRVKPFQEEEVFDEGSAALRLEYNIEVNQSWGGSAVLLLRHPDAGTVWDFSGYEHLSLQYYNKVACSDPGRAELSIVFFDASNGHLPSENVFQTEWWYSYHYILDDKKGWNKIDLPLKDVGSQAQKDHGSTGFWLKGREGIRGNSKLDLDKIWAIGFCVQVKGPQDFAMVHGQTIFDNLVFDNYTVSSLSPNIQTPDAVTLKQNYPNPFNPSTTIPFSLRKTSAVRIDILNALGQTISTISNTFIPAGNHQLVFDATDLPSGRYYYRILAGSYSKIKKMTLIK